ncbi:MAG: anti-sigma factor [Ilumatobacteraceae bacterium]
MPDNCEHWHGLIAEGALHPLDPATEADVTAHLLTCTECRALADEFASTAAALATARPAPAAPAPDDAPSAEYLYTQISTRIATERNRQRRRTWSTGLIATAAAALITVFAINIATSSTTRTAAPHIALSNDTIDATAVLEPRAWGTQIRLEGQGFTPGRQYNVWLEQANGTHIPAGTFTGVANTRITVTLASALPQSQAIAIGVSQPDGTLIVRAPLT